ncbi:TetR/AcrR family transcriptional regulator [Streptomyces sp. NPDC050564]|uniref:TetR/AcrR family transcriptional regulator n=1 Tax=Streptomyces sp. NPDC050564 TaxID=3365631 RepID=UPI0037A4884C
MDKIARRAGVGPGTVHRHFPTKETLFEAVVVDHLEPCRTGCHGLLNAVVAAAGVGVIRGSCRCA